MQWRPIYIERRLKTRKWQHKDTGADKFTTEIVADQMQMLGGRGGDEADAPSASTSRQRGSADTDRMKSAAGQATRTGGLFANMDDDIPFE